jgi:thiamine biosynthesis lipoprotein
MRPHDRPWMLQRRQWLALAGGLWLLPSSAAWHERQQLFGGPADVLVPENTPRDVVGPVWRGLEQMNRRWNAWKPGDVGAVNRAFAAGRAIVPTPAVWGLIQGARAMESLSLGCFNAGIGGLVARWGFHADVLERGTRPRAAQLEVWRNARPSLHQIERTGGWLRSRNPHLQLDFGGYAKGVALDWALDRLRRAGVASAVVNLGGNLAAMGGEGARPWRVGVRDPLGAGLMARISTQGREAVVTSGTYERYRVLDGVPCAHVLDPEGGQPVSDLISVTVVHPNAALADAAATALLVAGPNRWQAVAQNMGLDQVLLVDRQGRRQTTPALLRRLEWLG